MIVLGVDYGRKKIGLALSEGRLAEPIRVLKVTSVSDAVEKIKQAVVEHKVGRIVLGISEGEMAKEEKEFAKILAQKVDVIVETWDETLTTEDAKSLSREAHLPRGKRQRLEDAFAATLMLQSFLDSNGKT